MRLDHLSYAAGPEGLAGTARRLEGLLGEPFVDGGIHPRFGTANMVLPLAGGTYIEIVEALDHPASDKAPFGQAVRSRSAQGGGWFAWVLAVPDIAVIERRLGRESVLGNRHRPDGHELRWRQLGVKGLQTDPQLPFFMQWLGDGSDHPGQGASQDLRLECLEIAGSHERVEEWLGAPVDVALEGVRVRWVDDAAPGLVAARFATRAGSVRV